MWNILVVEELHVVIPAVAYKTDVNAKSHRIENV